MESKRSDEKFLTGPRANAEDLMEKVRMFLYERGLKKLMGVEPTEASIMGALIGIVDKRDELLERRAGLVSAALYSQEFLIRRVNEVRAEVVEEARNLIASWPGVSGHYLAEFNEKMRVEHKPPTLLDQYKFKVEDYERATPLIQAEFEKLNQQLADLHTNVLSPLLDLIKMVNEFPATLGRNGEMRKRIEQAVKETAIYAKKP
jgi:hypothetical protein